MKLFRHVVLIAAVLLVAKPLQASSITILVGDKDGFGANAPLGGPGPWHGPGEPMYDGRSPAEQAALDGAQLTDVYSALYFYGVGSGCDIATDPGCSPNGDRGTVFFSLGSHYLRSATLSVMMGDFQCTEWYGAMTVDINGVNLPFCFNDGFQVTALRSFTLTPEMIDAANLVGEVRLTFDHSGGYETIDENGVVTPAYGSFDYIAFDYFQLDAVVSPEPGTFVLLGLGLAGFAARRRWRR